MGVSIKKESKVLTKFLAFLHMCLFMVIVFFVLRAVIIKRQRQ